MALNLSKVRSAMIVRVDTSVVELGFRFFHSSLVLPAVLNFHIKLLCRRPMSADGRLHASGILIESCHCAEGEQSGPDQQLRSLLAENHFGVSTLRQRRMFSRFHARRHSMHSRLSLSIIRRFDPDKRWPFAQ